MIVRDQDICETDGFLFHPFHIFNSFLELYDTVFHKPEPGNTINTIIRLCHDIWKNLQTLDTKAPSWKYTQTISATTVMTEELIWLLAVGFISEVFITEP